MITGWLQDRLDVIRLTSPQRWAFVGVAVATVAAASVAVRVEAGQDPTWTTFWLALAALAAAARPGSHTGLFVVAMIALLWLGSIDDVTTPLAIPVALCLLAFHTVLALMAATAHSATVDATVLRRWAGRGALVAVATVAVWALVDRMARLDSPGNARLTAGAFLVLAAAALVVRARTLAAPPTGGAGRAAQPSPPSFNRK